MAKAYNLSFEYILYEMSYANIIMYGAVLPSYDNEVNDKSESNTWKGKGERINADDPANREKVNKILFGK